MTDVGLHRGYNIDPTSTNPLMFAKVWRRLIMNETNTAARNATRPLTSFHGHADAWDTRASTCRLDLTGKDLSGDAIALSRSVDSLDPRATAGPDGFGPLESQRRLWPPPDRAAQHSMKSTLSWQRPMSRVADSREWWEKPKRRSRTSQGSRSSSRSSAWSHPLSSNGGSRRSHSPSKARSRHADGHGASSTRHSKTPTAQKPSGPPDGSDVTQKIGHFGAPVALEAPQRQNFRVLDRTGHQRETALRFKRDVNYTMQGFKWPPPKV